jgi:hypothetical protein
MPGSLVNSLIAKQKKTKMYTFTSFKSKCVYGIRNETENNYTVKYYIYTTMCNKF